MPIYKGGTKIGAIKKGNSNIKKVLKGATLFFGKEVFEQAFRVSGSITFPATMYALTVVVVGAGGNGGGANAYSKNAWWTGAGGASGGA